MSEERKRVHVGPPPLEPVQEQDWLDRLNVERYGDSRTHERAQIARGAIPDRPCLVLGERLARYQVAALLGLQLGLRRSDLTSARGPRPHLAQFPRERLPTAPADPPSVDACPNCGSTAHRACTILRPGDAPPTFERTVEPRIGWQLGFLAFVNGYCPYCQNPMQNIHVSSTDGVTWSCFGACNP